MAPTVAEANAIIKLLRYFLGHPGGAGPVTDDTAREAAMLLSLSAHKKLLAGLTPADIAELWAKRTDQDAAEKRFGDAIDWLLNSRYTDLEAVTAFWGIADGHWTADDAEHGSIDGVPLSEIPKPDNE